MLVGLLKNLNKAMDTLPLKGIAAILSGIVIEIIRHWPFRCIFSAVRRINGIQLSTEQLALISKVVKRKAPCRLLVFGMGNDSLLWSAINRGGVTVFLEDNMDWFKKIARKSKHINGFLVDYGTRLSDWKKLLESSSLLKMPLPEKIEEDAWDVILVDAPEGWHAKAPGRMKSIFLASRLVKNKGDVFVHDCNRSVEDLYCHIFLKKDNLKNAIPSPMGLLRHYHFVRPSQ